MSSLPGTSIQRRAPVATIALAQLFGTSLWFSANSAAEDLMRDWNASASDIGWLTNAVQLGFILGTLTLALTGLADRFAASRIFVVAAVMGAALNAAFAVFSGGMASALALRLGVGACLAGIYPLGMKLIVSWTPQRAGAALALLVGMLTLGTALPHALRVLGAAWDWRAVILGSSVLALLSAALIQTLGDGPHLQRRPRHGASLRAGNILDVFRLPRFRAAALGYFGHMWELYAFWTLVPMLVVRASLDDATPWGGASGLAFAIIAAGAAGSVLGGGISRRTGSVPVAAGALAISGTCCLLFGLAADALPAGLLLVLLLVWGASVVADSPHFSALSAAECPPQLVGSALAIQNSIGFAISVVSIAAATALFERWGLEIAWLLLPGPILGLIGFRPLWSGSPDSHRSPGS